MKQEFRIMVAMSPFLAGLWFNLTYTSLWTLALQMVAGVFSIVLLMKWRWVFQPTRDAEMRRSGKGPLGSNAKAKPSSEKGVSGEL